jgi:uncharacterized delta-60 repeat protein
VRRSLTASALVLALTFLATPAVAKPGQLDRSFNGNGKNSAFAAGATGYAVAINQKGRILVAGYTLGANTNIALARFLPNGHFDPSFGGGTGRVITDLGGTDYGFDVAIQPNGSIVVAGERDLANSSEFAVVRYGIHGVLDKSFSGDGKAFIDFGRRYQGANAVAIGGSGNIVVGGFASNGTADEWALARLRPNGTLDPTFGKDGKVTTDMSATNEQLEDLLIGPGGTITAAGFAESGFVPRFALAQYLIGGGLNPTFGSHGKSLIDLSAGSDIAYSIARQPDGKFVLAGFASNGGQQDWGLARVGPHGRLDPTFGHGGKVVTHFTPAYEYAYGVALQANGKILVVGRANRPTGGAGPADFCVARYRVTGVLDDTFGVGGKVFTDFDKGGDTARGLALQADGRIVVGGEAQFGKIRKMGVARYLPT